tara:strand:- start:4915 stop:5757 length:843 start_codon:yes stop_codon:yes gene_type:complete
MITLYDIIESDKINDNAKQWALQNIEYLNKPMKLFGSSQKVEKGSDKFNTYILYLQPADKVATKSLCVFADSAGCKKPCLISSGQLGMSVGQNAATKRTILMLLRPEWFNNQLLLEIDKAESKALRDNIPALFRLNGTSDIDFDSIIKRRPASMFYDYTKVLGRVRKNKLANYDLTFSGSMYSDQSRAALKKAVKRDYRIAIAVNTKGIKRDPLQVPTSFMSFDKTDLRHLDKAGIGLLKRKGSNISERIAENSKANSFFVTGANVNAFVKIIATTAAAI